MNSPGPAEQRLNATGIFIHEQDFGGLVDAEMRGCIALAPALESSWFVVAVRPGLIPADRESFAAWAAERFARFLEHGPGPDGWQERSEEGVWQLWARGVDMPPLD